MPLDEEFLKQVLETFGTELDENLQIITDGLLELEKTGLDDQKKSIDSIFRSAHNIKGSARGIGITDVGEIAHRVETLFTAIKKKTLLVNPDIINVCLQAVDGMREAMHCYMQKKPISFDVPALLQQLQNSVESPTTQSEILQPRQLVEKKPETSPGGEEQETPQAAKLPVKSGEYETVRVSLHNLDRISAYMEEIQLKKIAIDEHFLELAQLGDKAQQFYQTWKKSLLDLRNVSNKDMAEDLKLLYDSNVDRLSEITSIINRMHKNMTAHINELTMLSNSLQEEVRLLRLVPTSNLLQHLPRVVRDLCYTLKKQVTLEVKDRDTKIDKIILDGIKDPIIHILRNAIDHGLEDSATREAHGKPEVGCIQIDVKEEDNNVLFFIKDDGGGIDPEKVANSALEKGMISKSELALLSKDEIMNLIFHPGFSTKNTVTDVSGRGIGLDVVRANLANLKGGVSVVTEIGKGTTFILRVPLTLATERGLIVECGGQLFALVTSFIERVVLLNKKDIVMVEKSHAILLEKHPVPLCSLSDILELDPQPHIIQNQLPLVVIKKDNNMVALLVNNIIGEREIVIKSLQAPLANITCVTGATLSGNGDIIIVLNLSDVMDKAVLSRKLVEQMV